MSPTVDRKRIAVIIAKVIKDLNLFENCSQDSIECRVTIQKVGYLLQKVGGLNFGFKFEWLSRGPYSRGLQNYYQSVFQYVNQLNKENITLHPDEVSAIQKVESLILEVKNTIGSLNSRVLENVTSLIMLCSDVYPTPDNPVDELVKRKNISPDDASKIVAIVKKYGFCT